MCRKKQKASEKTKENMSCRPPIVARTRREKMEYAGVVDKRWIPYNIEENLTNLIVFRNKYLWQLLYWTMVYRFMI